MSQPKSIGQALSHFAMAFGHMAFGQRPDGDGNEETDAGQEDDTNNSARAPQGACCIKRGGAKVKRVRAVPQAPVPQSVAGQGQ